MELIDKAKAEGVDCTLELYPYPSGCTFVLSMLPSYMHVGGPDAALERLRDPSEKRKLVDHFESRESLGDAVISYSPLTPELEGMSIADIAKSRGVSMSEAALDLLVENDLKLGYRGAPPDSVAVWQQVSRDSMDFLSRPDYMVGSDSIPIGRHAASAGLRDVPPLPGPSPPSVQCHEPGTDRPEDDRQSGPAVRPD